MNAADGMSERLLRLDSVAERLSISKSMAWKLVAYGQLPRDAPNAGPVPGALADRLRTDETR